MITDNDDGENMDDGIVDAILIKLFTMPIMVIMTTMMMVMMMISASPWLETSSW